MARGLLYTILLLAGLCYFLRNDCIADKPNPSFRQHRAHFQEAYQQYPSIPDGLLEGVAFAKTRFQHINPSQIAESCSGLPAYHGVMGLVSDGKGYFRESLLTVVQHSNTSAELIKRSPRANIIAYASAYVQLKNQMGISSSRPEDQLPVLAALSEIPYDSTRQNDFALNSFLYEVLRFMDRRHQTYGFPQYNIDFIKAFGKQNYQVLSASQVKIQNGQVKTQNGLNFQQSQLQSGPDYPPAIWDPAPSCNYSSRNGTAISAVTVHTIQGSYSGAISWFKNCNANVTSHYVFRSVDGQVTQMVHEQDKAWHVGNANPYTIGFEHEGYISDPSWYTQAMYRSSADVARDITNSGYGIDPLRTYDGPACSGGSSSCELGGCIKIKGHHHFPNQTHTDPGPNWNWERYYRLINNNPQITTKTASSGTFTDRAGPSANYQNDQRYMFLIEPSGASSVTLNFNSFHLEQDWDYLYIYDGDTIGAPLIGTFTGPSNPGTITSSGGALLVEFRSDCATTTSGWEASWTSGGSNGSPDSIAPATAITGVSNWETEDFTATFADNDDTNGTGIAHQFYQVRDFNGTEWRANPQKGFYSDQFDSIIHPDWQNEAGTWNIANGHLLQSDESLSNTNLHASLNQTNAGAYLYHWAGKMDGSGNNRRAGLHFSCDSPSLSNRGNSYFVYARVEDDRMQIYKVTNNVFALEENVVYDFKENQWYDFKVLFNRSTGHIQVYVNNNHIAAWTDSSVHSGGDYISLRSGNCRYAVNNLNVYHARNATETVEVGSNGMVRYQSQNPTEPASRLQSIVVDSAQNLSAIASQEVKIDWTPPQPVWPVKDGISGEVDSFTTPSELSANWQASSDSHSAINNYWYAIGTSPADTNVTGWTDNWFQTSMTDTGLTLTQGETYYVSVRAENGAGLLSPIRYTNGQTLNATNAVPFAQFSFSDTSICRGDSILLVNNSQNASSYQWQIQGANPSSTQISNPTVQFDSSGTYDVQLIANGPGGSDTNALSQTVNVWEFPQAAFKAADTVLTLPDPVATFVNQSAHATSYEWSFGDGTQSFDEAPWHEYQGTGVYDVTLTAKNPACSSSTIVREKYIRVEQSTGLTQKDDKLNVSIIPNPATENGALILSLPSSKQISIRLVDLYGRTVKMQKPELFEAGYHNLSLAPYWAGLPKGIFIVEVRAGDEVKRVKAIKE